jgi:hypothetical protein
MNKIEKTAWAKKLKKEEHIFLYNKAIEIASNPDLKVTICKTDETGEWVWAISADDEFWLDAFKTKKEVIALCKTMGWKYEVEKKK